MKESITFWLSRHIADLGLFIVSVVGVIVLCAIFIGITSFISTISKKVKKKQKEYQEKKN